MLQLILIFTTILIKQSIGSALYGPCNSNEECGTFDTFCNVNGTCECKGNFMTVYDSCVPVAKSECSKKEHCHRSLGGKSTCRNKKCVCRPFHHLHRNQCVKNRDLHDVCEFDHQCYCGEDCVERIACIDGKCTCKTGFKPYSIRRCIADPLRTIVEKSVDIEDTRSSGVKTEIHTSVRIFILACSIRLSL